MELMAGHKFISSKTKIKIVITKIEDNIACCDRFSRVGEKLSPCNFPTEHLSDFLSSELITILIEKGDKFTDKIEPFIYEINYIFNGHVKYSYNDIEGNKIFGRTTKMSFVYSVYNNVLIPIYESKPNINLSMFPHICPLCNKPAYISGLQQIDCSNCSGEY